MAKEKPLDEGNLDDLFKNAEKYLNPLNAIKSMFIEAEKVNAAFVQGRVRLDEMNDAVEKHHPDILVHLAAETDLEKCEADPDYAYKENFIGTSNACVACRNTGIPLIYISTAGVFDGLKATPYTEFDIPNPINVYGMSKWQGEEIVRHTMKDYFIIRAGWMVGGGERDKKFVRKIIDQLSNGADEIFAVDDRYGTPTYAPAFSKTLERLMKTRRYGTYHLTCRGRATRYDVAAEILRILGRDDVKLTPVKSSYFKDEYFAPRPRSEEMRNYVLEMMSMDDMPDWRVALEAYLEEHFSENFR